MNDYSLTRIGDLNREAFRGCIPADVAADMARNPNILALGALSEGRPCGALVFEMAGIHVHILSLHVADEALFGRCAHELLDEAVEAIRGTGRVIDVDAAFSAADAEEERQLLTAYGAAGFTLEKSGAVQFELRLGELLASPALADAVPSPELRLLSELPPEFYVPLNAFLRTSPHAYIELPLTPASLLPEFSVAALDGSGRPVAALICNAPTRDGLSLALIAFRMRRDARHAVGMFGAALRAVGTRYPAEARIRVSAVSDSALALVRKFAPDAAVSERAGYAAYLSFAAAPARDDAELIFSLLEGEV